MIAIRPYGPESVVAVTDLQKRYAHRWEGARVIPPEVYALPAYAAGANILCAYDARGELVGYAPLSPAASAPGDEPLLIWTVVKVDPAADSARAVQDALLEAVRERAQAICAAVGARNGCLIAQCQSTELDAINFLQSRGWRSTARVYDMSRDLGMAIEPQPHPEGIAFVEWLMRSEGERLEYLQGLNRALPQSPSSEEMLRGFLAMAVWPSGTTIAAKAEGRLVGNVMVYQEPSESERAGHKVGVTEDIWVLPEWRRRGIATSMISRALTFLADRGYAEARLQVEALNEQALGLYERLGYRVIAESHMFEWECQG